MNLYIWCAVGGIVGWLAAQMMTEAGRTVVIENVLVGAFGGIIGAEAIGPKFIPALAKSADFNIMGLVFALVGAVVLIILLRLMRKLVGPMKQGKSAQRKHL